MAQTEQQIAREAELVGKYVAHSVSVPSPALTPAERAELSELLEVTV